MSSDITILEMKDSVLDLEIHVNSVGIRVSDPDENSIIFFDMTNKEHRMALKNMLDILQHQLNIHEESAND